MKPTPFDLETWPLTDTRKAPKPIAVGEGNEITLWKDWNGFTADSYVGCFIPFDLACVSEWRDGGIQAVFDGLERQRFSDIAVREQLIDIEKGIGTKRSYSLAAIAERRLKLKVEKEDTPRLDYWKVEDKPVDTWPAEFKDYLLKDLSVPLKIWESQEADPDFGNKKFEAFEVYSSFVLYLISAWGIRADAAHVRSLLDDSQRRYDRLCEMFRKLGVMREDGSKDKKRMEELVTKAYNGKPPRTDKGNVKTDKVTLLESGDPTLEELTGDGPVTKVVTTYGKVLECAVSAPYCAKYNVLVSSGRTSGNFQQWPRGNPERPPDDEINRLRASFRPRPGFVFCSCDVTAAELGSLAQVCYTVLGWSKLRDAINSGQDLHTRLAARFAGEGYEDFAPQVKKVKLYTNLRQAAKPVNFGLPGMMGALRLVAAAQKDGAFFCELVGQNENCPGTSCKKCLRLAYQYKKMYEQEWGEVPEYHRWVQRQPMAPFVTPCTGFRRGGLFPSEAANQPFQHLTSRGTKLAIQRLARKMYVDKSSALYGSRMVAFFHDEAFAELREEVMVDAAWEMAKTVREACQEYTPDVKVKVEPALMRAWYKGAETVYDEKGTLKVWTPS